MKKLILLFAAFLIAVTGILAQTPDQFKYQALLRNADGTVKAEENVTVVISILKATATGTSVFDETHNKTTSAQGLISMNIGSIEDLSVVDWSADTNNSKWHNNGFIANVVCSIRTICKNSRNSKQHFYSKYYKLEYSIRLGKSRSIRLFCK